MRAFLLASGLWLSVAGLPAQAQVAPAATPTQPGVSGQLGASITPAASRTVDLGMHVQEVAGVGLRVNYLAPQGACEQAGLRPGDVIKTANDQFVRNNAELDAIVQGVPAGGRLRLVVSRAGVDQGYEIVRPAAPVAAKNRGLGVSTGPVTAMNQARLRVPDYRGAVVTGLYAGYPAHRAGIPHQAVIVGFDKQPVNNPDELRARVMATDPDRPVSVTFLYQGQLTERFVLLMPSAAPATHPAVNYQGTPATVAGYAPPAASNVAAQPAQEVRRLENRMAEMERRVRELEALVTQRR